MKPFATAQIRNVALVAHHGVGKTSLAEAMLFLAKATSRLGRIADGTTLLDYAPDEVARQMTINLGLAQFEWAGHKVNLLDTPGYPDFVGDVYSALRVADSAILMLRANAGVEVGTEVVWETLRQERTPTLLVVNMMDREHADFGACVRSAHDKLGLNAVPTQLPIGQAETFRGIVDLIENKAFLFTGKGMEEKSGEAPIPAEMTDAVRAARALLMEEAATGDESLMNTFLDAGELSVADIRKGLCERVVQGDLAPVFCCAAFHNQGVKEVLDEVIDILPSPLDVKPQVGKAVSGDAEITCPADAGAPAAAVVFKTLSEQHLGDLSLVRIFSGRLEAGKDLINTTRNRPEKLSTLYHLVGKERLECSGAVAGDIVAGVKLRETHTGDALAERTKPVLLAPPDFPEPVTAECIHAKNKGDEEKMAQGLARLHEEDPTFRKQYETSTHETLVHGMGDLQLEIMVDRLKKRFGVEVLLTRPRVPYRETIKGKAQGEYRHKKQTGGRGQFGEVHLRLEPRPRGQGFEFLDEIKGGVVPNQFIPAVEKGVVAAMEKGPLAGYPVVDVAAALFFGKYHDVDSSEMAFKIAAESCFHEVMRQPEARAVLLEPVDTVMIRIPGEFLGDVMGDLSGRRGRIHKTDADGHAQVVHAEVPGAELYKYAAHLRSLTQGRGMHAAKLSHYQEVPREIAEKVIAAARAEKEASAHA
ncbi:MAG: elongation factor G [Candidatus Eisenbacteria bacterium]|uniref:Elongation factor G n=1 Tax=Eiseniibacteriota bacterium TaxID=2212470 RepID=A0A9D6LAG3_UNCEI|nr:elongation factor G [Candidatus Eisenbacteria bacterium]MBI3539867.1 elongation factor G [Candidatus Eisenbacteria bacterium]